MIGDSSDSYLRAHNSVHDLQGLRGLRRGAEQDDPEALQEVARQFEALFIQMILKNSRQADELIGGEEALFNSSELRHFQGMLDEQYALSLSQAGGIGLAETLVRQLSRAVAPVTDPAAEVPDEVREGARRLTEDMMQQLTQRSLRLNQPPAAAAVNTPVSESDRQAAAAAIQAAQRPPLAAAASVPGRRPLEIEGLPVRADKRAYFESPEAFVRHLYPMAEQAAERLGLDPRVMLAQSALETGWGRYMIPRADGSNSFNLFGIKADQRWEGDAAEVQTLEYRNGQPRQERWAFRAYESFDHAMQDYVDFLQSNPRYQQALHQADNPVAFAQGLQQAGYATDPRYASKLLNIMDGSILNRALQQLQSERQAEATQARHDPGSAEG